LDFFTNSNYLMMSLLDKDTLKEEILLFLPQAKRGKRFSVFFIGDFGIGSVSFKNGLSMVKIAHK